MKLGDAHLDGHSALAHGSIIIGMLWGSLVDFLIDKKPLRAMWVALTLGALTLVGTTHSPVVDIDVSELFWGYVVLAGICGFLYVARQPD